MTKIEVSNWLNDPVTKVYLAALHDKKQSIENEILSARILNNDNALVLYARLLGQADSFKQALDLELVFPQLTEKESN